MSIGILYESIEWSNMHLCDLLHNAHIETELINLQREPISLSRILNHDLLVNRLFPSAQYRSYQGAFAVAQTLLKLVKLHDIPMINPFTAYAFDCSKMYTYQVLKKAGLPVPKYYAYFCNSEQLCYKKIHFPCVLKPDCGGRSLYTYIVNDRNELESALKEKPSTIPFIIQNYIQPKRGYTTRVEVIGESIVSIMKRYVGTNAISSYHAGSHFKAYGDCPESIRQASLQALDILSIQMGSLDIIETGDHTFCIIDVNATSNFSEDNVEILGFDPIEKMAEYIISQHDGH